MKKRNIKGRSFPLHYLFYINLVKPIFSFLLKNFDLNK